MASNNPPKSAPSHTRTSLASASPIDQNTVTKPTAKRYIIQFLYCLNLFNRSFHWIQVLVATKKLAYYYDVENYVINSTSVVFLLSSIILTWPACIVIERIGIRRSVLIASFGTSVGAILKCLGSHQDQIALLLVSQTIIAMNSQLIFGLPSRLASVWFPDSQVSSAVSASMQGIELGIAMGFLIPQLIMDGAVSKEEIGQSLQSIFLLTAALSVFTFIGCLLLFDEAPKYPPGEARLKQTQVEACELMGDRTMSASFSLLIRQSTALITNRQLVLLSLSYGITIGTINTMDALWNQMLEPLAPGDDVFIGATGLCLVLAGVIASVIWGRLLDFYRRYLLMNVVLSVFQIVALLFFAYAICYQSDKDLVYTSSIIMGIFQTGLMAAGMELAVELTYPAPELVTSSVMNMAPQLFGAVSVFVASYLTDNYGVKVSNLYYLICYSIALLLMLPIKETLNRQQAATIRLEIKSKKNDQPESSSKPPLTDIKIKLTESC